MKKIVFLAGIAACAYGAVKLFRGTKETDEFASGNTYDVDATYPNSPYGDNSQSEAA